MFSIRYSIFDSILITKQIKLNSMNRLFLIIFTALVFISGYTHAQKYSTTGAGVVSSAVPFLSIAPDSRGGAMGDAGVATSSDVNSQYWNPAKYSFNDKTTGIALSYTPWLRSIIEDMNLSYLVGYHKLDDLQTLSASLRYFDLGDMEFFDEQGTKLNSGKPNEFAFDMGYALKLTDNWSGSVAFRYIRSDIYSGTNTIPGQTYNDLTAGNSFAADIAFFYTKDFIKNRKESNLSYGINISNIGSKISYDGGNIKDFIPTNLRTGVAYTSEIDQYNKISATFDINKLLVPTPPYVIGEDGNLQFSNQGNNEMSTIEGIFKSFSDSPGGFSEELQEITYSLGIEYWYANQFALRTGYFHENADKGNRKFLTFGAGLKMNVFSLDFSYIFTMGRKSPLENTLRFTLGYDIENFRRQGR